jgi:hypothetical protein
MEGDANYAMLKAIENGSSLYYIMSYRNTAELKEFQTLSQYYSVNYAIWKKDVIEQYNELNALLADVQTKLIIDHKFLSGTRVLDVDELIAEIESIDAERSEYEAKYDEQLRLDKINAINEARSAARNGVKIMKETLTQLEEDVKAVSKVTDTLAADFDKCERQWTRYQDYLAQDNAAQAKVALRSYNMSLSTARRTTVDGIKQAEAVVAVYDEIVELVDQANMAVELLQEAGAAQALIDEAEKCVADTVIYFNNIKAKVDECLGYIDAIYAAAEKGGLTKEDLAEYLEEEEEDDAEKEEEVVDKFFIDNNYIVSVTYGNDDGTPYKTFILNYNNFAVTVKVEVDGEERVYTVPGSEYVEIRY